MTLKSLFFAGAATLALASCSSLDDNSTWDVNGGEVKFTSYIKAHRASGTAWADGDAVGIYMKQAGTDLAAATAVNKKYITDALGNLSAAAADQAISYPAAGNADFIAYYPYTEAVNGTQIAINVADQSNPAALDLLYSNNAANVSASGNAVNLGFTHKLSALTFTVNADASVSSTTGLAVTLSGIVTEATFDLATGNVIVPATPTTGNIQMNVNAAGTQATAIVVPASVSGVKAIFTLNGKSVEVNVPAAALESGKSYEYPVNITISGGETFVSFGQASISDWTTVPGSTIDVDFGGEGGGVVDPTPNPTPDPTPGTEQVIFEETFGESVEKGSDGYWPSITYDTWTSTSGLTITDPIVEANGWKYSNASVRQTSALDPHVWFAANKDSEMKISGFDTTGYTNLKLTYSITANASGDQSDIKVVWGGVEVAVPAKAIATTNTYQEVELTGLTAGATTLSFVSNASDNTAGFRVDNIKLVGTK